MSFYFGLVTRIDDVVIRFLLLHRTPLLTKAFYFITYFGEQMVIGIMLIILLAYLYLKKEMGYLYSCLFVFLATDASVYFIKIFVNRARPSADMAYYLETSKSFPSAHAAIALAFFGFVAYYLIKQTSEKNQKSAVIFSATLLVLLVGFSSLYLGEHYLSDVLAGFIVGGMWLIIGIIIRQKYFRASISSNT